MLTAEAQAARMRESYNERQSLAWHTAVLQRAKRVPRLTTLLITEEPVAKPRRQQTWQEQLAVMDRLGEMMQRIHSPMQRMPPDGRDSNSQDTRG